MVNGTPRLLCFGILWITSLSASGNAFAPPSVGAVSKKHQQQYPARVHHDQEKLHQLQGLPYSSLVTAEASLSKSLTQYAMEVLISNGIPAVLTCAVIAFAAAQFRSKDKKGDEMLPLDETMKNPAADLYRDLYGSDDDEQKMGPKQFFDLLKPPGSGDNGNSMASNKGIPSKQYITIRNLNQKFDSYQYSLQAATQSKATAAAALRAKNFDRAIRMSMQGTSETNGVVATVTALPAHAKAELLQLEKSFLKEGAGLLQKVQAIQTQLTKLAIDEEMAAMGISPTDIDPVVNSTTMSANITANGENNSKKNDNKNTKQSLTKLQTELTQAQKDLMSIELNFVKDLVMVLGAERANGVRMALLGDIAARGSGGLLTQLQERPLTTVLKSLDHNGVVVDDDEGESTITTAAPGAGKSLYVAKFPGDVQASQVNELREEVTAIVRNAKPGDEALVILQTGGGTVTGYGLAAAQLLRFKEAGMKLTIAVEQVAASGGYMMCCVADKIIGSPFAIFGSIGVISEIPNVYERLKKEGIEFQTVTAGEFKRTLTPTKKVTKEDLQKSQEDIEDILVLFRDFVGQNRPNLDLDKVATGETWFGTDAIKMGLCDEIKAVDDVLTDYVDQGWEVYEVEYTPPLNQLASPFPIPGGSSERGGMLSKGIRWVVRTIASEIRSELANGDMINDNSIEKRYMARDDKVDRIRSQG